MTAEQKPLTATDLYGSDLEAIGHAIRKAEREVNGPGDAAFRVQLEKLTVVEIRRIRQLARGQQMTIERENKERAEAILAVLTAITGVIT